MMSIYTKEPQNDDWCFIVIAGDRGFAGGYNNNLFRLVEEQMEGHEACVLPIGKKALEHFFKPQGACCLRFIYRGRRYLGCGLL